MRVMLLFHDALAQMFYFQCVVKTPIRALVAACGVHQSSLRPCCHVVWVCVHACLVSIGFECDAGASLVQLSYMGHSFPSVFQAASSSRCFCVCQSEGATAESEDEVSVSGAGYRDDVNFHVSGGCVSRGCSIPLTSPLLPCVARKSLVSFR